MSLMEVSLNRGVSEDRLHCSEIQDSGLTEIKDFTSIQTEGTTG